MHTIIKSLRQLCFFSVVLLLSLDASSLWAGVYFSEYIEGSSFNKALEIYNSGPEVIDLAAGNYRIEVYFNGNNVAGTVVSLTGALHPQDVYVLADGRADAAILEQADQTTLASLYNGDDAIVLMQGDTIIDSIGQVGFDPGSQWGSDLLSTQDNTLRRLFDITHGDTVTDDAFDPSVEWEGFPNNSVDDIGRYEEGGQQTEACGDPATLISAIQGSGSASPLLDATLSIEAVVIGDFQGSDRLRGFFVQEEDADGDADVNTSEGLFIFDHQSGVDVQVGDRVRVKGRVAEFNGLTELSAVSQVSVCAHAQPLPVATIVYLPVASLDHHEAVEGMQVRFPHALTVTENYNLGRYGELLLSSGRLYHPANIVSPGAEALAMQAQNNLNRLLMDDGSAIQNPDSVVFPAPGLSADNTLRSGSTVTGLTGVMHYAFGDYRVVPMVQPVFTAANPRKAAPALGNTGQLKIASFNVLNYFNGDGLGGGFPTSRGATTGGEFLRQRDKIIHAIIAIDADIIGLIEIENDGYAENSAIADLVNSVNASLMPEQHYTYINPGVAQIGSDEIAVGLIYRAARVAPHGMAAILSSANSIADPDNPGNPLFLDSKNRPALAQTFVEQVSGEMFTLVVNHFKSKGSSCDDVGDPDLGDGQGNCNITRTKAARALLAWLNTDPTRSGDDDRLIIGDLNAYAKEDPITVLRQGGYVNLLEQFVDSETAYSYVFEGQAGALDHALASSSLRAQIIDATVWHINADEPRVLDYNEEFKSPGQIMSLYAPDPFRSSDHDPVVVVLDLQPSNIAPMADFYHLQWFNWVIFISSSQDADGRIVRQEWDFGDNNRASGLMVLHRYTRPGHYPVRLTVTDDDGGSGEKTRTISIR